MQAEAVQLFPMDNSDNTWRDEVFEFLNDKIDQIIEQSDMEKIEDITGAIFQNKSEILGRLVLGLIKKNYSELLNQEYCDCPICSTRLKAWNKKVKRTIESLGGCLDLYRPYFYCKKCHEGFYPLYEALGLSSSPKQHDIQDLEAWLSSELPFETAAEAFTRCTGDTLSPDHMFETANNIANHFDILDICPTKDEIDQKINELSKGKFRRPVMMMAIDGAHAPIRAEPSPWKGKRGEGEWKEAKGFRLYLIDTERIVHLISWHQVQDDKEVAEALLTIKDAGLIPEDKVRLCAIGDGAAWIWNRVREIFPTIKEILDFYHCSEYIHDLANAQYGKGNRKAQEWVEATFARLFHNQVTDVIRGIKRMEPKSAEAKKKTNDVVRYLSNHRAKVDYGSAKRGGYHIGSGAIESANKFIAHVRLKRSGAWWYITNANNILKLRCAKYNGTYDRIIHKYRELDREKVYAKFHLANGF
jgi:hypothetical protein